MPSKAVRIEGLRELDRAFKLYGNGLEKGLREAMEAAAEPVRSEAAGLARSTLKVSSVDWTAMRVGVTRRTAYVAPVARGAFTKRNPRRYARGPRIKARLLDEAMEPALDHNVRTVEREFSDALDDLGRMWSRV